LRELSERRGYELNVLQAEHLTKDEQLRVMARTTVSTLVNSMLNSCSCSML
jgi:hypothetical protein